MDLNTAFVYIVPFPIHASRSLTPSRILLSSPNTTRSLITIGFESPYNKAAIIRFEEIMKICTQFYMVVAISFKKCIEKVVCSIVVAERCYTFRDNIQNCTTLCFLQRCYTVCEKLHKVTHNPETGQGLSIQFIV
jgi:hypothetical protein